MPSVEQSGGRRADLVLEGGGVRGIGLVGAAGVLSEAGYSFPRIAGTSAGAIVGAVAAALQVAGRPLSELQTLMRSVDYRRFKDESFLESHLGAAGEIGELLLHMGIAKGDYLVEWLGGVLADLGVETFADLAITPGDDPGSGLPLDHRYRLAVCVSDLSRGALVRLPWDADYYGIDPGTMRVVDAVRASMSIPFFFRPVRVKTPQGTVTWVDGGLLSNFPVTIFDRTDGGSPRWPTWGVKLSARPASVQVDHPVDNDAELAVACLTTLLSGWDRYHLDDGHVTERTIFVDAGSVSSTDFGITPAQQDQLFVAGRNAATKFLAGQTAAGAR
ncbi:MAG: patatin [Mycobacterium sp.]|nr:patatin [Mycobacterium sp.]